MDLLHAWKDQLWKIGGEGSPPRPRVLRGSLDKGDDDEEWTDEDVEAAVVMEPKILKEGDTPKELSREGVGISGEWTRIVAEILQRYPTPCGPPSLSQFLPRYRNCHSGRSQ